MVSTFTTNIQLEELARGDDIGTWDTPVNANMTLLDLVSGGQTTIALNNAPVVLASAQFQCSVITFNSTLTANVAITFPTSFKKPYLIRNACTGSSAFVITLQTTASGGQVICPPPGDSVDAVNDGTNLAFHNLGRVGTYWDYSGTTVPLWVSNCTVPPYLNCNGGAFSAVTYPALAVALGGTTLPDSRGRTRLALNQGITRISSNLAGFNGDTLGAGGGDQQLVQHVHANTLNDPGHVHGFAVSGALIGPGVLVGGGGSFFGPNTFSANTNLAATGMTISNAISGAGLSQNVQPSYMGGITMIRAG